jgi:hypothetical protein
VFSVRRLRPVQRDQQDVVVAPLDRDVSKSVRMCFNLVDARPNRMAYAQKVSVFPTKFWDEF